MQAISLKTNWCFIYVESVNKDNQEFAFVDDGKKLVMETPAIVLLAKPNFATVNSINSTVRELMLYMSLFYSSVEKGYREIYDIEYLFSVPYPNFFCNVVIESGDFDKLNFADILNIDSFDKNRYFFRFIQMLKAPIMLKYPEGSNSTRLTSFSIGTTSLLVIQKPDSSRILKSSFFKNKRKESNKITTEIQESDIIANKSEISNRDIFLLLIENEKQRQEIDRKSNELLERIDSKLSILVAKETESLSHRISKRL